MEKTASAALVRSIKIGHFICYESGRFSLLTIPENGWIRYEALSASSSARYSLL
jgi:hypothetical protein